MYLVHKMNQMMVYPKNQKCPVVQCFELSSDQQEIVDPAL
jgi:hypothetical protein